MLHQNDLGIDEMYRYTYFINFDILEIRISMSKHS